MNIATQLRIILAVSIMENATANINMIVGLANHQLQTGDGWLSDHAAVAAQWQADFDAAKRCLEELIREAQ